MEPASDFVIVFVTAPDTETARAIIRPILEKRLAACANILPGVESHFWWEGKIDRANEVLILFKCRQTVVENLEQEILASHPYDTPEIVTVPIALSSPKYLEWLRNCTE